MKKRQKQKKTPNEPQRFMSLSTIRVHYSFGSLFFANLFRLIKPFSSPPNNTFYALVYIQM